MQNIYLFVVAIKTNTAQPFTIAHIFNSIFPYNSSSSTTAQKNRAW